MTINTAPYGSWKSPITSDLIASSTISLAQVVLDGPDTYWVEGRPAEGGRQVIVKGESNGSVADITPPGFNVRTTVHEYGGGAYVVESGEVFFSNYSDQHLYRQSKGQAPSLVNNDRDMRYADVVVDRLRNRLICIREDHSVPGTEAVNTIVAIPLTDKGSVQILASGSDFYSSPTLSPDGSQIAFLSWNHPNMPWDGTELHAAKFAGDGTLTDNQLVAGSGNESIFQPEWSPDGDLYFVSDRTDWWNIYRRSNGTIEPVCQIDAEFGCPQWNFGYTCYAFESAERIVCAYSKSGLWNVATIDTKSKTFAPIESPYTDALWIKAASGRVVFRGGSPTESASIIEIALDTGKSKILKRSSDSTIDPGYISLPETIEFPTENGLTAHGFFYRPTNKDFTAQEGETPPLLVKSHGGPTGCTSTIFNPAIQYWTSRGVAVLDVNYGGSTGYGSAYRRRLDGMSGVVEIDDCSNGALFLVKRGDVDGERLMISGGSAGGYVTLCALTFRDVFKCGASHYGIGDCEALAADTHKFESRYCDRLIGPYPERKDLYRERAPLHYVDRITSPILFTHGLEDKVVPPNQAETMVAALRAKGIPVAYLPFEGEQHGYRRAENIKRALDGELYFYSQILGFKLAEPVEPVQIENLPVGKSCVK